MNKAKGLLESEHESDRSEAVALLSRSASPSGVELLARQLEREPSAYVRRQIIRALGEMRSHHTAAVAAHLLASAEASVRNAALEVMRALGPVALTALEERLLDPSRDLRKLAVDALAAIPGERAGGMLLRGLDDPDPNVAAASAEALGGRAEPGAVAPMQAKLAKTENVWVAFSLIEALARLGDPASMAGIDAFLTSFQGGRRERTAVAAIWAFAAGRLGDAACVSVAWELRRENLLTAKELLRLLHSLQARGIDPGPSFPELDDLIARHLEDGGSREAVAAAHLAARCCPTLLYIHLPYLVGRFGQDESVLEELLPALLQAGPSPDRFIRLLENADDRLARLLLGAAEQAMVILPLTILRELAGRADSALVRHAVSLAWRCGIGAESFLTAMTVHPEPDVAAVALSGLGLICGEGAVPALLKALEHPSGRVRRQAADTLSILAPPGLQPELERLFDRCPESARPEALEVMTALGGANLHSAFLRAAAASDRDVRSRVARASRLIRSDEVFLSVMESLANDPDQEVRRVAIASLASRSGDGVYRLLRYLYENDPCQNHRYHILACPEIFRHPETFEWLTDNIEQTDPLLRLAAVRGMARMGAKGKEYLEALLESLSASAPEADEEIAQAVGQELKRIGGRRDGLGD
ncbi:hypothetical protein GTO89_03410 [Heliobacterium gestii]|uniref:HEAT repeat domain-containing protein n=1 Tax=Heliomicrobium gestii TaxID=2699 RepID=A0A845LEX9_HELGE|nr:HEAT repeat domain-containing protein [Heliomicrobium gestii]MBM7865842.1 HEAT repeat protein [Heliomicrobium gestii]MZP42083.1 hypothetical protein [Heliomicrobium gestii]